MKKIYNNEAANDGDHYPFQLLERKHSNQNTNITAYFELFEV